MQRTHVPALLALVQTVMVLGASALCSAQDSEAKVMFVAPTTSSSMEAMTDGLGPLTLFVASEVVVMMILALFVALLLRRPVRDANQATRAA